MPLPLVRVLFLLERGNMEPKMLREIANDAITPKKRDVKIQNDLYEKKNDGDFYEGLDFDDEFYGGAEL